MLSQASLESMVKAAEALDETPDFVFVDGNRMPPTIQCDAETVVKGDSKVYSIAAASIIAKVSIKSSQPQRATRLEN